MGQEGWGRTAQLGCPVEGSATKLRVTPEAAESADLVGRSCRSTLEPRLCWKHQNSCDIQREVSVGHIVPVPPAQRGMEEPA